MIQLNAHRTDADIGRIVDWLAVERPDVVTVSEARHDLRDLLIRRLGWRVAGAAGDLMIFTPARYLVMNRPKLADRLTFVNATYARGDGALEVATAHLSWPTSSDLPGQIRGLDNLISRLPRERLILTGDFNATPWSSELRRLDASLGLTRRDRATATWPARVFGVDWPLPILAIDHIYAGAGWATVSVHRGPNVGSDHYPLVAILAPVTPLR